MPRKEKRNGRARARGRSKDGGEKSWDTLLAANRNAETSGTPLLTEAGIRFVCEHLQIPLGLPAKISSLPYWDSELKQLWYRSRLLKEYRQPAANQIAILAAFQALNWRVRRIDDPIPPFFDGDKIAAKQRLRETIKNLNRGLPHGTIAFHGDGTGQGVLWAPIQRCKQL